MLSAERVKRQDKLVEQLKKLSEKMLDENELGKVIFELKTIYSTDFRHNYSEFFPLILDMNKDDTHHNLDYLSSNLETLRAYVEDHIETGGIELLEMHRNFDKLCDHLNLEIGRVLYYSQKEKDISSIDRKLENVSKKLEDATDVAKNVQKKSESLQTELISVLSIFSAIVITFSGSLTFIGSAITAASSTFVCKLILILLVCAFILFNTIIVMMYLIGKIIGKTFFTGCGNDCCACTLTEHRCTGIKKIRLRIPYVYYFNLFTIIFIFCDVIIWFLYRTL